MVSGNIQLKAVIQEKSEEGRQEKRVSRLVFLPFQHVFYDWL